MSSRLTVRSCPLSPQTHSCKTWAYGPFVLAICLGSLMLLMLDTAMSLAHDAPTEVAIAGVASSAAQPVDESVSACEDFTDWSTTSIQIQNVEANPNCADRFVKQMLVEPAIYLDAFYTLIGSSIASDALWWAVFQHVRAEEFRFSETIVADMQQNLGNAISACTESDSCGQWQTFIMPALEFGELYRCPDLSSAEASMLLAAIPHGDYYCIESIAQILAQSARYQDIKQLFEIAQNSEISWARRNGIRVIGRMLEQPGSDVTDILVSKILADQIAEIMLDRLAHDPSEDVLLDAIWILDTFFHPSFDAQDALFRISENEAATSELRFRAMASINRLIQAGDRLHIIDLLFLERSLKSSDPWVRGYAAFAMLSVQDLPTHLYQQRRMVTALRKAFTREEEFSTRAAIAQAIDGFQETNLLAELKIDFEENKLSQKLSDGNINVRSGLALEQLPPRVSRMQGVEKAFFEKFTQAVSSPTPESTNDSLELLLFASEIDYQQYMDAFVGYGSEAGGLYLENSSTLYTYEREPNESRFTVEHLIQHEYTHYLTGRYVFPGLWSDPGYHAEPKGWLDEGTAEYFAELELNDDGKYVSATPTERLLELCDTAGEQSLHALIDQRAGYDQPGTFSYDLAWSFVKFLIEDHPESVNNLVQSFRDETYQRDELAALLGFSSLESVEAEWRGSLRAQCADLLLNAGGPTGDVSLDELEDSQLPGTTGPKRDEQSAHSHVGALEHEIITIEALKPAGTVFNHRVFGAPPPPHSEEENAERFVRLIGLE